MTFGTYIKEPAFHGYAGFDKAIDEIPLAREVEVTVNGGFKSKRWKAIAPAESIGIEEPFGFGTKEYVLMQHREPFKTVAMALQDIGIKDEAISGSLLRNRKRADVGQKEEVIDWSNYFTSNGDVNALLQIKDPQFEFELLHRYAEPFMVVFRLGNGIVPGTGMYLEGALINMVCVNFSMHGRRIGKISIRHVGDVESMMSEFEAGIRQIIDGAQKVPAILNQMFEVKLENKQQFVDVLLGLDLPAKAVIEIADMPSRFTVGPQRKALHDLGYNLKSTWDIATNWATWHFDGSLGSFEKHSLNIGKLLDLDLTKLTEKGKARRIESKHMDELTVVA